LNFKFIWHLNRPSKIQIFSKYFCCFLSLLISPFGFTVSTFFVLLFSVTEERMKENRMESDGESMEVSVVVLPFKRRKLRKNDDEEAGEAEMRNGGEEAGKLWRPSHWCFAGADTMMSRYSSSFDWEATSLGPVESWPPCLWYSVSVCLTSRFPMVLWLGEDLHLFYNDAYAPVMGDRHPSGFGVPGRVIFHEIWGTIGQQLKAVQDTKKATWSVDQLLIMFRHGYMEGKERRKVTLFLFLFVLHFRFFFFSAHFFFPFTSIQRNVLDLFLFASLLC
jgi:hypothetical protein